MIILPPDIRFALRTNNIARRAAQRDGRPEPDAVPVLKLFNPIGPAIWIATELGADDDALFGAADLGFECPELGYFSASEIAAIRLPFGMRIERDTAFATRTPLSVWADIARRLSSLREAEAAIARTERGTPDPRSTGGG
ncbi:DUF2958 domain-containing protein [Sphingomonas abietis]|uniref:DUF2958 domain-containing protein n=1 Tax=Sphingomonas abietis TaxID=3012344 RepID=A0ABY7NUZ0_9SPHN|nr:DUF2958 domain-containing protein [Sphingomonas abietis]WBO24463.1 DUF2958 domain-containing protein [Sphingomonas abietis]